MKTGRRILITGASSGIGYACAKRFAEGEDELLLLGRNSDRLEKCRGDVDALSKQPALSIEVDLGGSDGIVALWKQLDAQEFLPDVLINNAGVFLPAPVLKTSPEQAASMMNTNFLAPWMMLQEASRRSIHQRKGLVVLNILSVTALKPYPACGFYGASKAALKSLMESARAELRHKDIRITNLIPGATDTPVWDGTDLDRQSMMAAEEVAEVLFQAAQPHSRSLIEDIVLRPTLGDF
jgi:short-subunit dehydrogenase